MLPLKAIFIEIAERLSKSLNTLQIQGGVGSERHEDLAACPVCGTRLTPRPTNGAYCFHNPKTCSIVNLALAEMGVTFDHLIRVNIYNHSGPLKGYYFQGDPYTIHIADEAYSQFPEYTMFHETKHMVDCLTKGWSEEVTPDSFARALCAKYGFRCPIHHQHYSHLPTIMVGPF